MTEQYTGTCIGGPVNGQTLENGLEFVRYVEGQKTLGFYFYDAQKALWNWHPKKDGSQRAKLLADIAATDAELL